jgi:hypothetical protein
MTVVNNLVMSLFVAPAACCMWLCLPVIEGNSTENRHLLCAELPRIFLCGQTSRHKT